jgi:hypothetical protein
VSGVGYEDLLPIELPASVGPLASAQGDMLGFEAILLFVDCERADSLATRESG